MGYNNNSIYGNSLGKNSGPNLIKWTEESAFNNTHLSTSNFAEITFSSIELKQESFSERGEKGSVKLPSNMPMSAFGPLADSLYIREYRLVRMLSNNRLFGFATLYEGCSQWVLDLLIVLSSSFRSSILAHWLILKG